jgi:hypothetical protein
MGRTQSLQEESKKFSYQLKNNIISPFAHENRLKRHRPEALYFAINIMITAGELYVFHLRAGLDGFRRTLYRQIFDKDYSVAILQHVAIGIFHFG